MSEQPRTRQELYDLVRQRGKDEFVLEEMIRLGFWPAEGTVPEDPADDIRQMGKLRKELQELRRESRRLQSEKILRRRLLKERLAESRRKQKENKEKREQSRIARAEAWQTRKQTEIGYLGAGVSAGLDSYKTKVVRLREKQLPLLGDALQIAQAMEITVPELRFMAFNRQTSTVSHYVRFQVPKKTGGVRVISAPMPRLKKLQHWILTNILEKIPVHDAVHGFRRDRSIVSNATPHVGAKVIINFDLQDFFPSISYKRVKGLFRSFGYAEATATILGLLCTEAEQEVVELDGKTYYVALGDRHLPQGSPASPAITNIMGRRLDKRLTKLAEKYGFVYTRYADDLTFSTSEDNPRICNILKTTESIVTHEGFQLNPSKTRVLRPGRQQEVTGIVVNEKLSVDRKTLKRFRATLHQIEKNGLNGASWGKDKDVMSSVQGFANFVAMVDPVKGGKFLAQIERIKQSS